jgi:hypothetical protein
MTGAPIERDAQGRYPPGSIPGWGYNWWLREFGIDPAPMTPEQRFELLARYWPEVGQGWRRKDDAGSPIPESAWTPHHPFRPAR